MATKWADYIITAVRFNSTATHIEAVQIRADNGDSAGDASEATRTQIVNSIDSGTTYCTATVSDKKWHKGAAVKVVVIDNQKFIKTKADNSKADNLDNLPTF
jgi:hypothetical protein